MSGRGKRRNKDPLKDGEGPFLQWKVPCDQITGMLESTAEEIQLRFEEILELRNQQTCLREAALLDCYVSGFCWAKQAGFTPTQVSFTMALLAMLLDNMREKQMSLVSNVSELAMALQAARQFPAAEGDSRPLLETQQAKALTDYLTTSLLYHYRLYQCLLTKPREELLIGMEVKHEETRGPLHQQEEETGGPLHQQEEETGGPLHQQEEETGGPLHQEQQEEEEKQEEEVFGQCSIQEGKEVLGEVARGMQESLEADFNEKLRLQEEAYTAKLHLLKHSAST